MVAKKNPNMHGWHWDWRGRVTKERCGHRVPGEYKEGKGDEG